MPDGKSVVAVGGPFAKSSEVMLCDLTAKTVKHIEKLENHRHHLVALALSPDSQVLVIDCTHSFVPWKLDKADNVLDKYPNTQPFITSLTFSPDSKLFAVADSPSWNEVAKPGELKVYDVPAWEKKEWREREPRIENAPGALLSIAFSPDGKLGRGRVRPLGSPLGHGQRENDGHSGRTRWQSE
jgi:WD40 repeat protein